MDWSAVSFDWNRMRAFLVTAEEGSFSAAARALGTTQPTVGRQIAALEEELDLALFERVGRGLELTPTGLELVEHVRTMADAALRVSRVAAGQSLSLDGPVSVSASDAISTWLLPPILAEIHAAYPGIELDVVATNDVLDLGRREADIAVRNFRPSDPALVARKLRDDGAHLYGTPAYLESIGSPTTPEALSARAAIVGFDRGDVFREGLNRLGLSLTEASFPFRCASMNVQWALVTQGSCLGIMMDRIGDADPRVVRALPDLPAVPVPMWLTSHREVRTSRRVRVVFDVLAERLAG